MGAFSGSITIRRYRVMGSLPRDFRDSFARGVRAHALVPLDPKKNPGEERAIGWCCIHDNEDLDLDFDKFWLDGRVVLALRIDVIKPSAAEVKRQLRIRQREEEARSKVPLSKAALRNLKEQVIAELRVRTPPKTRVTDVVWNIDEGKLFFHSHSKTTNELFTDLFAQTFGLPLDLEGPGSWAQVLAEQAGLDDELAQTNPTPALLGGFAGLRPGTHPIEDHSPVH